MRILIDFNHPAHVHLFKNFIWEMEKKGHKFCLVARNKECTTELLDTYGFKYTRRKGYKGLFGKAFGMLLIDWKLFRIARKFKPDVLIGEANPYIAQVGWIIKKPTYIFDDTEHAKLQMFLIKPFATRILTPYCYKKNLGKKQLRYDGFKESAYINKEFKPNKKVLKYIGIRNNEKYIIIRLVNWEANHDKGEYGIQNIDALIKRLEPTYKIIINSEKKLSKKYEKYLINIPQIMFHSAIYYAEFIISEGASVASESAILGTPTIYVNTLKPGYISELERIGRIKVLKFNKITKQLNVIKKTGHRKILDFNLKKWMCENIR